MIIVSDIIDRIFAAKDAEGSDYYTWDRDLKPAINSSIEWAISVITPLLEQKKFSREGLRHFTKSRVFQTSSFGRLYIDSTALGIKVWSYLAIHPKPYVYVRDDVAEIANIKAIYLTEVRRNVDKETQNEPIVKHNFSGALLGKDESLFRPELVYTKSDKTAARLTSEEWNEAGQNPHLPGFEWSCDELLEYGYLGDTNYSSEDPIQKTEIDIRPRIPNSLVAIEFIAIPTPATLSTDTVYLPESMLNLLVQKALAFMALKDGDNVTSYQVSNNELVQLIQSLN